MSNQVGWHFYLQVVGGLKSFTVATANFFDAKKLLLAMYPGATVNGYTVAGAEAIRLLGLQPGEALEWHPEKIALSLHP